jgi:hypothetical protein
MSDFYGKARTWIVAGVFLATIVVAQQLWVWEVERVEVPSQRYMVKIHRWGKDLPEGEIVAPDDSYKGVLLETPQAGRYFLNPIFWDYEVHNLVNVPPGQCLVLTRKYGKVISKERLARGDILAEEGERGIVPEALGPGAHPLNPYAYSWELVKAVEIGPDQVGVRTLKVGKDPRTLPVDPKRPRYVVPEGYRGVQETPIRNGTYYINPYKETVTPVEVRSHRAELHDIEFPSRDGFILKPHVFIEYQVRRGKAPEVVVRLSDEGLLHQQDSTPQQQEQNEILQKVLLPHIRGYARIEGSNFDARDFIITNPAGENEKTDNTRERLQKSLLAKVQPRCRELGIDIRAVLLGPMPPPPELADQISQRDLARVKQAQNMALIGQYKEMQKLKSIEALKKQNTEKVHAETRLSVTKTLIQQQKEVAEAKLKQDLENAQIRLDAARLRAESVMKTAKADAAVIDAQNEAEVAGLRATVKSFTSAAQFAQFYVLRSIAPALHEIFASDDSEFAKLFSSYMTPPPATGKPSTAVAESPVRIPNNEATKK